MRIQWREGKKFKKMSSPRILVDGSLRNEIPDRQKSVTLLSAFDRKNVEKSGEEESEDLDKIVAKAEAIAREDPRTIIGRRKNSKPVLNKREYAQALHREADIHHLKGNYELALVLYHRAARACPRETSHGIAVRRTAAVISSVTNPSKAGVRKIPPKAKNVAQLEGIPCPETVAKTAQKIIEESADPVLAIDQILKYFDSRKDFVKGPPTFRDHRRSTLVSRSRTMLRQFGGMASIALENLQVAFAAGDFNASLRIGKELLAIAEPLIDRHRYEVAAHHYLAMSQIPLGRHDRAVDEVTLMIKSAQKSGDVSLKSRSFMTLGRVHLTFRHLDAAAKAWEKLVRNVDEAVPKAWLLHEIGRCYFEMKRYNKALETSYRCLEYAEEGDSQKWQLHGQLLTGQSLVELGRLGEAVIVLQRVKTIADAEKDNETRGYVSDLIDRITQTLRQADSADDICDEKTRRDQKIVEKQVRKAKSEDVPQSGKSKRFESSRQKSENLVTKSGSISKLTISRSRKIKSPKNLERNNSRILSIRTRRNDLIEIVQSSISASTSDASTISDDDILLVDNIEPSDNADETQDDLFTSRTRVIEKKGCESANSIQDVFAEQTFVPDEEQLCVDGESSNRTGKTYVLD